MLLKIGDTAPEFSLYNTEKVKMSLSSNKGSNVVLVFFPFAFSSTCTKEVCLLRDDIASFENLNARVYALSTDSVYSLKKYKEDQKLNFELLSDYNKTVSEAYGSLYDTFGLDMVGVTKRSVFVIDTNGIIRHSEILENASEIPDLQKVKETLANL